MGGERLDPTAWMREALVAGLWDCGVLRDQAWAVAFAAVPRHVFVPRVFRQLDDGRFRAVAPETDEAWDLVYGQSEVVTQLDGDDWVWERSLPVGPVVGEPSRCSSAAFTARLLDAVTVPAGRRVLQVGAGCGYGTGLLCHRFGDQQVVSVDIDPAVVRDVPPRLASLAWYPTVVAGDGCAGFADAAPYDAVVSWCALPGVPSVWLAQAAPGAQLVVPLHDELGAGAVVVLTVGQDATAQGRFLPALPLVAAPASGADGLDRWALLDTAIAGPPGGQCRTRVVDPAVLADQDFRLFAALRMPDVVLCSVPTAHGGRGQIWLLTPEGSWGLHETFGTVTVALEHGERHLWCELTEAHHAWCAAGRPTRIQLGLTVSTSGCQVWMDNPDRVLSHCALANVAATNDVVG